MSIWCVFCCRDDDEDIDHTVYLKPKADPRLDRNLTIIEFILAFMRYMNVICEVFSHRRRELTAYLNEIIRLSGRFGQTYFYDYYRLFTQKAEALLQTRNILVDWSKRDQDIYFSVFSGLRPVVYEFCRSPDHFTHFCKKVLEKTDVVDTVFSNQTLRGGESSSNSTNNTSTIPVRASHIDHEHQHLQPTCKYFNGAGFGKCIQSNCRFLHLCARCRGNHSKKSCPQKAFF